MATDCGCNTCLCYIFYYFKATSIAINKTKQIRLNSYSTAYPASNSLCFVVIQQIMMTSSNGSIFLATGPLCGEFTDHQGFPLTKASDAALWFFLSVWINGWTNNREAGDLRRHHAHYDIFLGLHCYTGSGAVTSMIAPSYNWPRFNAAT